MTVNQPEVCVGGCLQVTAGGILEVNTGGTNWPYDCPESDGQPLYCGEDGVLRTRPIPRHEVSQQFESFGSDRLLNGGETPWCTASVTNPSDCLAAQVVAFGWVSARYQVSTGNRFEMRVESQVVGGDDPVTAMLAAGRGAPGGGPARARAVTVGDNPNLGRSQVIASNGDVRRQNVSGTDNLVQSDSAVSIQEGVIHAASAVNWDWVPLDNGTRELGGVNGAPRPRRFTVDPGDTFAYRIRVVGLDGSSGDTFSDVNAEVLLMLTTQPGVP